MIFMLYYLGNRLSLKYKLNSLPAILVMLVFTINEGLRFGRGVDYNIYWQGYIDLAKGWETNQNIGLVLIEKIFLFFNVPFQGLIIFMSFTFILGTLFFMKRFKEVLTFAMPLWVLFSFGAVENLLRWFLAFSFIMIGLSYLLNDDIKNVYKFIFFSFIGCIIHYAIIPIPFIFYFLSLRKMTLFKPKVSVVLFIMIIFLLDTNVMLTFVDALNKISYLSDRFTGYGENAEFWLTNNALGDETRRITFSQAIFFIFLIIAGYPCSIRAGKQYVFAYNIFLLGAFFYNIGLKVELVNRFVLIFYFFSAIVFASVIKTSFLIKNKYRFSVQVFILFFLVLKLSSPIRDCIKDEAFKYMYVWDEKPKTPDVMLNMYLQDKYKQNKQYERKDDRINRLRRN